MRHGEIHRYARRRQIEQRQAEGKELAENHPFGQAGSDAKPDALRQIVQRPRNAALVARFE